MSGPVKKSDLVARDCGFHDEEANKVCFNATDHHALKYHDPTSDFYIGESCAACAVALIERRLREQRENCIAGRVVE
jgi:hypothetical protein